MLASKSHEPHAQTSTTPLCLLPEAQSFYGRTAMLCTSGFVDDEIFSYNGPSGGDSLPQHPVVWYWLRLAFCTLSRWRGVGLRLDESLVNGPSM